MLPDNCESNFCAGHLSSWVFTDACVVLGTTCILHREDFVDSSLFSVNPNHQVAMGTNWKITLRIHHDRANLKTNIHLLKKYSLTTHQNASPACVTFIHNSTTALATFWWSLQSRHYRQKELFFFTMIPSRLPNVCLQRATISCWVFSLRHGG